MALKSLKRAAATCAAAVLALAGCSGDTETKTVEVEVQGPRVSVSGDFVVVAGGTLQLTATTANGTDASYTWASSDSAVANVSATGLVTGVVAGNAVITATGADTQAAGTYNIVVANEAPDLSAVVAKWSGSGHADSSSMAFRDWDADGAVPSTCARCHSSTGFADYLPDGVTAAQPIGGGIDCGACHNADATALTAVKFPSTVTVTGLGAEARCIACHQGRQSTDSVNTAIVTAAAADDDTVAAGLSFKNVHYFAAGATQNGGAVRGGYQYEGNVYDVKFGHVPGLDSCIDCHDPHSLAITPSRCATCHTSVTDLASVKNIREKSSYVDYDGDGSVTEGVASEIDGLRTALYGAIQAYATAKSLPAICYNAAAHPYFFEDANADGACDDTETTQYASWTNRLIRATYNYQFLLKDPGAFAHNAKYAIQLAYDSIEDLDPAAVAGLTRDDEGHFQGTSEAFRHWDHDDPAVVGAACTKCHAGSVGFQKFLSGATLVAQPPQNGLDCATCHAGFMPTSADPKLVAVTQVTFPSTVTVSADSVDGANKLMPKSFICITCHSGREAKKTVDDKIATGTPGFRNIHYAAAGATLLGTEAKVGYEYDGKVYVGRMSHSAGRGIDCSDCHDVTGHTFRPLETLCGGCHATRIRVSSPDFDGDGVTAESLEDELAALAGKLLAEMQTVATTASNPICYSATTYPYFIKDTNANGVCDAGETTGYTPWTAALAKAAFNYQLSQKDHGAWAHNPKYVAQLLIDSIADLGGDVSTLERP